MNRILRVLLGTLALIHGIQGAQIPNEKSTFEPQVSTYCTPSATPVTYINSYFSPTSNSWMPDPLNTTCLISTTELLSLCQRLYPTRTINNVVESNHNQQITFSATTGTKSRFWLKSYKCLESPFQSDALLVPNSCLFDHLHNTSCWNGKTWNQIANTECEKRSYTLKSYGVLLPCGVGVFTGVEFVCCPKDYDDYDSSEEDEDDDDEDDDVYDLSKTSLQTTSTTTTTTTTTTTPPPPTMDSYYQRYDVHHEHQNYLDAEDRLENRHKSRINHVINDWNVLEDRYQGLRVTDIKKAEDFKHEVTLRFQKTIKSLEEESLAEKKQLLALHQQRIQSHLNEKKKEAMECYTKSLNERPQVLHRVRKCLQKLVRVLYKDRHHTLNSFKHSRDEDPEFIIHRLNSISRTAEESLDMLERYPKMNIELRPLIEDYILSLQGHSNDDKLLGTAEENTKLVDDIRGVGRTTIPDNVATTMVPPSVSTTTTTMTSPTTTEDSDIIQFTEEPAVVTEKQSTPEPAEAYYNNEIHNSHSISNEFQQDARTFSIHREVYHANKSIYVVMSFGGIIIFVSMVIGLIILRKRGAATRNYDFLAVNPPHLLSEKVTTTPEEKHVHNMQVNGYVNPTYMYFESK